MEKYSASTIDPIQLIKKYQRSQAKKSEASTKLFYPTKFHHSEKAETTGKSATNDAFPRYTTSASFRKPLGHKSQPAGTSYGHRLGAGEGELLSCFQK